jgi:hypothetical protein
VSFKCTACGNGIRSRKHNIDCVWVCYKENDNITYLLPFNRNSRFYIKSDSNGTEIFKCGANEAMYSFKNIIKIITNEDAGRLITRCEKLLVLL